MDAFGRRAPGPVPSAGTSGTLIEAAARSGPGLSQPGLAAFAGAVSRCTQGPDWPAARTGRAPRLPA